MARRGKSDGVSRNEGRDEVLVSALAVGQTHEAIGQLIGRKPDTVRHLAVDPEVRRRVAERRREIAALAAARSTALVEDALAVLEELLRDPLATVRFRAANAVLQHHFRFAAEVTVLEDIHELRSELEQLRKQTANGVEAS